MIITAIALLPMPLVGLSDGCHFMKLVGPYDSTAFFVERRVTYDAKSAVFTAWFEDSALANFARLGRPPHGFLKGGSLRLENGMPIGVKESGTPGAIDMGRVAFFEHNTVTVVNKPRKGSPPRFNGTFSSTVEEPASLMLSLPELLLRTGGFPTPGEYLVLGHTFNVFLPEPVYRVDFSFAEDETMLDRSIQRIWRARYWTLSGKPISQTIRDGRPDGPIYNELRTDPDLSLVSYDFGFGYDLFGRILIANIPATPTLAEIDHYQNLADDLYSSDFEHLSGK